MDKQDWEEAAGVLCPLCGAEVLRIIREGDFAGCSACYNHHNMEVAQEIEQKTEVKALKRTNFFRGKSVYLEDDESELLDEVLDHA